MCLFLFLLPFNPHTNPMKYYDFLFTDVESNALERLSHWLITELMSG